MLLESTKIYKSFSRINRLPVRVLDRFFDVLLGPIQDLPRGGLEETDNRPRESCLPAPAFAHQPESLAGIEVEGNAVHGLYVVDDPLQEAGANGKVHLEITDA